MLRFYGGNVMCEFGVSFCGCCLFICWFFCVCVCSSSALHFGADSSIQTLKFMTRSHKNVPTNRHFMQNTGVNIVIFTFHLIRFEMRIEKIYTNIDSLECVGAGPEIIKYIKNFTHTHTQQPFG